MIILEEQNIINKDGFLMCFRSQHLSVRLSLEQEHFKQGVIIQSWSTEHELSKTGALLKN